MIVLDASAALELLLFTPVGAALHHRLAAEKRSLHAPHLLDAEVAQVLRRYVRSGEVTPQRAGFALADLTDLPLTRYPHVLLLERAWELRSNLSVYDALYVALAEALPARLLTRDKRLTAAPGLRARVEVL